MGVFGDGGNAKKGKRGVTNTSRSLEGFGTHQKAKSQMDWGDAMPEMLSASILAVTRAGGLVSFGRSRDLSALSVTVFLDGERKVVWYNGDNDLDGELEKLVHYFDSLPRP